MGAFTIVGFGCTSMLLKRSILVLDWMETVEDIYVCSFEEIGQMIDNKFFFKIISI